MGVSKNRGFLPQIIPIFTRVLFSMIFTIHFGVPLFLETSTYTITFHLRGGHCQTSQLAWSQNCLKDKLEALRQSRVKEHMSHMNILNQESHPFLKFSIYYLYPTYIVIDLCLYKFCIHNISIYKFVIL